MRSGEEWRGVVGSGEEWWGVVGNGEDRCSVCFGVGRKIRSAGSNTILDLCSTVSSFSKYTCT